MKARRAEPKTQLQQQHESSTLAEKDASYRRDLRDLRSESQRLFNSNQGLKSAADARRMEACASRKSAESAWKALEAERRAGAEVARTADSLKAVTAADKKTIARLQAQLAKGAPSARLLERARCLKRATESLQDQLESQALALSAKAAELESSRRESRALATALDIRAEHWSTGDGDGSATANGMLELGKARLAHCDLALELAHVSEASQVFASDKKELERRLSLEVDKVNKSEAQVLGLREALEKAKSEADGYLQEISKAKASTREARELGEACRSRETELRKELEMEKSRCAGLNKELEALSGVAERGEAMHARVESLHEELDACGAALSEQRERNEKLSCARRALEEDLSRTQQRVKLLESVKRERQRLEVVLGEERGLKSALEDDVAAAREELRVALAERGELVRGLRQAKIFNDQLAEAKGQAEKREREANARCIDIGDGKLALQRALLEQLSVARVGLRDERERREEAEAALRNLNPDAVAVAAESASGKCPPPPAPAPASLPRVDNVLGSDDDASVSLEAAAGGTSPPAPLRPRDTFVQDYLGTEGAEQFLSDWDEELSSKSSSLLSSPPSSLSPTASAAIFAGGDGDVAASHQPHQEPLWSEAKPPPPPGVRSSLMHISNSSSTSSRAGPGVLHVPSRIRKRSGGSDCFLGPRQATEQEGKEEETASEAVVDGAGGGWEKNCDSSGPWRPSSPEGQGKIDVVKSLDDTGQAGGGSDFTTTAHQRPRALVHSAATPKEEYRRETCTLAWGSGSPADASALARHQEEQRRAGTYGAAGRRRGRQDGGEPSRALPGGSASGMSPRQDSDVGTDLGSDPAMRRATAKPSHLPSLRCDSENGGRSHDDGEAWAGGSCGAPTGTGSGNDVGGVRGVRAIGGGGLGGSVDGGSGDKVAKERALVTPPLALGSGRPPPPSSLLDLADQSIDDI